MQTSYIIAILIVLFLLIVGLILIFYFSSRNRVQVKLDNILLSKRKVYIVRDNSWMLSDSQNQGLFVAEYPNYVGSNSAMWNLEPYDSQYYIITGFGYGNTLGAGNTQDDKLVRITSEGYLQTKSGKYLFNEFSYYPVWDTNKKTQWKLIDV